MKQNNELMPVSAQERKEDIDILMDSEMMDATIGGKCDAQCEKCSSSCKKSCNGGGTHNISDVVFWIKTN
ncbi:MAG: hypothetical protein LBP63_08535 [Prevotellaceae bacterium]|nr:hypothetical protein [Prevotellaceae bacterium]